MSHASPETFEQRTPAVASSDLFRRLGVIPYYQNQWCAVLHGDCREILPALHDQCFDLMLTDPPYGVDFVSNHRTATPSWGAIAGDDGSLDVMDCLKVALEKLTHSAHLYIFGTFDLSKLKITTPVELIWDKEIMSGGDLDCPWGKEHEHRASKTATNPLTDRETSLSTIFGSGENLERDNSGATLHPQSHRLAKCSQVQNATNQPSNDKLSHAGKL